MANSFKNTWWIFLLIAAGGVILFLSLYANKPQSDQGVVLNDLFHQPPKAGPVAPVVVESSPVVRHGAGFTIQVYSFLDKDRAQAALQTLKNRGYQAFLMVSDLGKKRAWYRVRIGGIPDEAAARKMLDEIRQNYNSGFIVQTVH
jgi:cell division septation protein DedD